MTATPKLRAAIIGCGSIGKNHIRAYLHSGRYQVTALADLSQEAMNEFDESFAEFDDYDATHYTDANQMLDTEEIDVVSVATWHKGHAPWTIAAATRGVKAVLCEKPMAEDLGHAEQMITVCARNNVKLVIAHQRRFLPSYNMARELIAEGAIGEVDLIRIYARDGLLNWSSHQFDMARYVLGDDECTWVMGSVERRTDRWERSTRIEDKAVATFGFASGANAIVLSDTQPEYHQGGMIMGTEGMIDLHTEHLRLLNASTGGKWEEHAPNGRFFTTDTEGYGFEFAKGFSFEYAEGAAGQVDELADWVEGVVETHRGEATHGYKAIEMAMAVYESARLHEVVTLPLQTRVSPLDLMVESGHLPVRYPGKYDIRARVLRGENFATDADNK